MQVKETIKISIAAIFAALLCSIAFVLGDTLERIQFNMTQSSHAQALMQTGEIDPANMPDEMEIPDTLPADFYVLLLGVDEDENRRTGEEAQFFEGAFRSDTIMVAHVNTDMKKISLCSLERDIKTEINGYESDGYYKLNAAYLLGGIPLMKAEAAEMIGVDIPYYAAVDMGGLTQIIDSLGGLDVDVERAFWDPQLQDGLEQGGMQHLNGAQAVMYCRSRYAWDDGDFARTRHQRQVLKTLAGRLMSGNLWELYSASNTISLNINTNLPLMQMFEIAGKLRGLDAEADIYTMMTPTYDDIDDDSGESYQILDYSAWSTMLEQFHSNADPVSAAAVVSQNSMLGGGYDNMPGITDDVLDISSEYNNEWVNENGEPLSDAEVAERAIAEGLAGDVSQTWTEDYDDVIYEEVQQF